MPNNFEVGDVVRCIEGSASLLTEGEVYTVVLRYTLSSLFIDVIGEGDNGSHGGWMPSRFVLVSSHLKPAPKLTGMTQFYKDIEGDKL